MIGLTLTIYTVVNILHGVYRNDSWLSQFCVFLSKKNRKTDWSNIYWGALSVWNVLCMKHIDIYRHAIHSLFRTPHYIRRSKLVCSLQFFEARCCLHLQNILTFHAWLSLCITRFIPSYTFCWDLCCDDNKSNI